MASVHPRALRHILCIGAVCAACTALAGCTDRGDDESESAGAARARPTEPAGLATPSDDPGGAVAGTADPDDRPTADPEQNPDSSASTGTPTTPTTGAPTTPTGTPTTPTSTPASRSTAPGTATAATAGQDPSSFHLDDPDVEYEVPRRSSRSRRGRQIEIVLRSSPPGAVAAVDGVAIGPTPSLWQGFTDTTPREFTFVLPGYAIARYRFIPTRSGIVHGTLEPIKVEEEPGRPGRAGGDRAARGPAPQAAPSAAPAR
jgi:hypothetical protein